MNMGEQMQPVVDEVNHITGGNPDESIKLLALVIAEYMLGIECTEGQISTPDFNISIQISGGAS